MSERVRTTTYSRIWHVSYASFHVRGCTQVHIHVFTYPGYVSCPYVTYVSMFDVHIYRMSSMSVCTFALMYVCGINVCTAGM
jgi:hypothetical protein